MWRWEFLTIPIVSKLMWQDFLETTRFLMTHKALHIHLTKLAISWLTGKSMPPWTVLPFLGSHGLLHVFHSLHCWCAHFPFQLSKFCPVNNVHLDPWTDNFISSKCQLHMDGWLHHNKTMLRLLDWGITDRISMVLPCQGKSIFWQFRQNCTSTRRCDGRNWGNISVPSNKNFAFFPVQNFHKKKSRLLVLPLSFDVWFTKSNQHQNLSCPWSLTIHSRWRLR